MYLEIRLRVYGDASLCALQRLFHLLHLDGQVSLEVPAQSHAGVFSRLSAGEDLIVAQQRPLVLWIQNLQSADLHHTDTTKRPLIKCSLQDLPYNESKVHGTWSQKFQHV